LALCLNLPHDTPNAYPEFVILGSKKAARKM